MQHDYDRWLERPYLDAADEAERFQDWCETHGIEFEDPDAESAYMDWIESQFEEPDVDADMRDDWDDYQ